MTVLLLAFSGFLAGIITGLAGCSASAVITPLLCAFGGYQAYTAITISLFTDVFTSAISAYTFKKHGNIRMKEGMYLSISAVIFSVVGSGLASSLPDKALGSFSAVMTVLLGVQFFVKSKKKEEIHVESPPTARFGDHQILVSIICGTVIGLICGVLGAGGGMMILLILTTVLGYDTKTAIGTSVFIMMFTALSGGIAHIPNLEGGFPALSILVTSVFGITGAHVASTFANKVPEYKLLRVVSIIFLVLGFALILQ